METGETRFSKLPHSVLRCRWCPLHCWNDPCVGHVGLLYFTPPPPPPSTQCIVPDVFPGMWKIHTAGLHLQIWATDNCFKKNSFFFFLIRLRLCIKTSGLFQVSCVQVMFGSDSHGGDSSFDSFSKHLWMCVQQSLSQGMNQNKNNFSKANFQILGAASAEVSERMFLSKAGVLKCDIQRSKSHF